MIDTSLTDLFPPHWISETGPSALRWAWANGSPPAHPQPTMVIGVQGEVTHWLTDQPTENGSWLEPTPEGLVLHLAEADKAPIAGRAALFCIWASDAWVKDEDACGTLVVSDWAARPHEGRA